VLVSIIEQDDIRFLVMLLQHFDAMTSVLVDSDGDIREFLLHLIRLVTNIFYGAVLVSQNVSYALPLVSSAQYGNLTNVLQQSDQVFYVWCLARTSHGDVPHRDDRYVERTTFQKATVKHHVTQFYP